MRPVDRQFLQDTSADDASVGRVIDRLGYGEQALDIKQLLSHLPSASPHAAIRIRNRLLLGQKRRSISLWIPAALSLAMIALFVWRFVSNDVLSEEENGAVVVALNVESPSLSVVPDPVILHQEILNTGDVQALEPVVGLRLQSQGIGMVGGTEQSPEIAWTTGVLDLDVDPEAGLSVSIQTTDGRISVLGTVFRVERNALGTEVSVREGRVQVDCEDGSSHTLVSDASTLCLPTTGAGMLARARSLESNPEDSLVAIERGLSLEPSAAIVGELLYHQISTLESLQREAEALRAARAYLSDGGPREMEVLRTAASLALEEEGCVGALPFLARLASTQEDAARYHEACTARIEIQNAQ